ncbi:MAG: formylmethanofuran dehydrogenase [Phycisphaerales bacterium]|jgi:formylmethanofuran dehydrogenase subunit E|nr:formylmethanofuran dehydrogenase [Phycisphaerales bacterium]
MRPKAEQTRFTPPALDTAWLPDDLLPCVEFHGHLCPGLVIGYCATKLAMQRLGIGRAEDEELIAIVENDSCAVDAVQVLTGCTFGKGNLKFLDHGKMAFTFATRRDGRSVRLLYRPQLLPKGQTMPEEHQRAWTIKQLLTHDRLELFEIQDDVLCELPPRAQCYETIWCDACGERTMATRIETIDEKKLCAACRDQTLPIQSNERKPE